jgi:NADH:ubiquinone oxidoreductase subunit 6 (subunit J)
VTEPIPLVLAVLLVLSSTSALIVKRLLWSLILLFYSSLLLGAILFWYGAAYAGLFHIITFAGAVSVMFMVIIMLVGQDVPQKTVVTWKVVVTAVLAVAGLIPFILLTGDLGRVQNAVQESSLISGSTDELGFLWKYQSWDIVFVLVPVVAAILTVINLFSKEGEVE